jgi:Phosphotransferase enzyme family
VRAFPVADGTVAVVPRHGSQVIGDGGWCGCCPGIVCAPVVGWPGGCRGSRRALWSWPAGAAVGWAGRAGKQGLVWRLDTAEGSWAVKVPFDPCDEDEVRLAAAFQEVACAAGVPAPQVRRTTEGCVLATLEGRQARVYEWVELQAPDPRLDPARVGAVVAAIHRVSAPDPSPLDPWYHEPVGAGCWDQLVRPACCGGGAVRRPAGRAAG